MNLTPWYPAHIKPARTGWYEVRAGAVPVFRWWGSDAWYYGSSKILLPCLHQHKQWRGLTQEAKR